jgi:hypothetical protein
LTSNSSGGRRTLISWVAAAKGDRLILSVEKGRAVCEGIEVNALP